MNKKINKFVYALTIISTISLVSLFHISVFGSEVKNEWINISNSPQCAADQAKPTSSILISATLRDFRFILLNTAQELGTDENSFVSEGNLEFRKKLIQTSFAVLRGLTTEKLPWLNEKNDLKAQQNWEKLVTQNPELLNNTKNEELSTVSCLQADNINSHFSNLFLRGADKSTLEFLAKELINPSSAVLSCDTNALQADKNLFPLFNFEVTSSQIKNFDARGFEFWAAYKIYLVWAWNNYQFPGENKIFTKLIRTMPFEQNVLLFSNGCKSMTSPTCGSDFLSAVELKELLNPEKKLIDLSASSLDLRNFIEDNNDQSDFQTRKQIFEEREQNQWLRTFQKKYLAHSQLQQDKFFQAQKLFSSLSTQKGEVNFLNDLKLESDKATVSADNMEKMYYLCSEFGLISTVKPKSFFETDLQLIKMEGHRLNQFFSYGLKIDEILRFFSATSAQVKNLCGGFAEKMQQYPRFSISDSKYKSWYIEHLKRYKIFDLSLKVEDLDPRIIPAADITSQKTVRSDYIQGLCSDPVECARSLAEGLLEINKSLIHIKTLMREELAQVPLFNDRAEKTACKLYDPWEVSRLAKKKLRADIGASLLFGWTGVPLMLNIDYLPSELVSLSKLVEDGQIKIKTEMKSGGKQTSLSAHFGALFGIPCSVKISRTKGSSSTSPVVFNGISMGACYGRNFQEQKATENYIDSFKRNPKADINTCGQCSLSFSQVAEHAVGPVFAPIRFFIRLADSVAKYRKVMDDENINPRRMSIHKQSLIDTFKKNNDSIPESCVAQLKQGLSCMGNICESMTARQFEIKSGLKVESVDLVGVTGEVISDTEFDAYIKVKNCSTTVRTTVRCFPNGKAFNLGYHDRLARQCSNEIKEKIASKKSSHE